MKRFLLRIFLLISFLFPEDQKKEKILFIGNSFTFYWNLPLVIESMGKERGYDFDIFQSTIGGSSLKSHWLQENDLKSKELVTFGNFSKVVLQDYSSNPLSNTEESLLYFNKFIDLVLEKNGHPFIFATWFYKGISEHSFESIDPIQNVLNKLTHDKRASLVPVDTAFRIFQKRYPNVPLFTDDLKHPSPVGTYLAACLYFKIFTGQSPLGLARRYERKDESGKKIFLGMVEKLTAERCQRIIDEII